jgi:2-iminobutanoate/2-iminopropanoate deaminase
MSRTEIQLPSRPLLSHSADAVCADGFVFVAGILPVDATGALVGEDDVAAQAEHVLDALGAILSASGSSYAEVAKVNVFLTDMADRHPVDAVLRAAFGGVRPAATLVGVSGLAVPGARIEVDAVALSPQEVAA